jgi:hypothetical protein
MSSGESSSPNFLKAAFANVYNLSLLGGALVTAAATGDWLIAAGAISLEALWLVLGPDLKPFQRAVRNSEREERERKDRARVEKLLAELPEREWQRARALDELRREIEQDMQSNPSFQAILLQTEIDKLSTLHQSFVRLAFSCLRSETYLQALDLRELDRQLAAQRSLGEKSVDPAVQALAKKNAEVIEKRLATIADIQGFLARARGQMHLIENTVRLLRDQALTMTSPDQLTEQLDDLMTGVEAVQQSARDAEALFGGATLEPVAPIEESPGRAPPGRQRTR